MARPKKQQETPTTETSPASEVPFQFGVWYVMKRDFSGWELYRRTKETIARCYPNPEQPGRVYYNVWGSGQAGGPSTCEFSQFKDNIVRVATEEDSYIPPETLA